MTSESKPARIPARLSAHSKISESHAIVRVQAPADYSWTAGQYLALSDASEGGGTSYYSIASASGHWAPGEFELTISGDSAFSRAGFQKGLPVWLSAAQGKLPIERLAEASRVVMIAMGTGVAPMRAVIQDLLARSASRPSLTLLQGSRTLEECLHFEELSALGESLDYRPVLSQADATWQGRKGRVQAHLGDLPASDAEICLCGSRDMVREVKEGLLKQGLSERRIYSDGG